MKSPLIRLDCALCGEETLHKALACTRCDVYHPLAHKGDADKRAEIPYGRTGYQTANPMNRVFTRRGNTRVKTRGTVRL
jgi:hypothetical protein